MSIEGLRRELLVRYLDTWVPDALRGTRRATFVQAWPGGADVDGAEAALRVFAEFADHMRGRTLTLVFVAPTLGDLGRRLEAVQAEVNSPPGLAVHAVAGHASTHLGAAVAAAQGAGAPLLACVDADEPPAFDALGAGRPAELLLATAPGVVPALDGFPLVCRVDLVAPGAERQLVFATGAMKHLEAFKNAVWQLDEYAGVRIRDPHDADGRLLDISLTPSLGPLRRELTAHLAEVGERTVTEIRQFALTGTVYRAADVTGALTALLAAGTLARRPEQGRLAGDTLIRPAGRGR